MVHTPLHIFFATSFIRLSQPSQKIKDFYLSDLTKQENKD